ncbi:energy transducer TonB [Shewanella sp. SP1S1-7]|uniref:energy transducer TonB n=1 Tax=Shewanella sp. SP1S1-7 TaxID=3063536 RepID=UPI002890E188|nr:energy transducer TonB [Shewanella sp. SP1S1-7]MDT3337888.1 energy transducer TonB [Shewanella sp. SP1S1-7]
MMIELLFASTLLTFVETDEYTVESCSGEKFELLSVNIPRWPMHTEKLSGLGFVDIRFMVDDSGKVTETVITDSVPFRLFDRESIRAVRTWQFNQSSYTERCFDIRFKFDFDKFNKPK